MSQVTLGGNPINVNGKFPQKGDTAPAFSLVAKDLSDATLATFAGKRKILNIFPSIDTPTCAASVRQYLVDHGIAPERVTSEGYGETRPLDPANDEQAWSKNRRVDFFIERWVEQPVGQ